MSRFYNPASSDSESDSESSDGGEQMQAKAGTAARAFQMFSEDEEDVRRVVRSEKEKRYEEIRNVIKHMRNHKKIKDMANVLSDFETLGKAYEKAKKVVDKEGSPRFYVRALVELDDFVSQIWEDREGRKTMSKNNSKGLSALRQKLKKYVRDFDEEMALYREAPDPEGAETESSEDDDDDSDVQAPHMSAADFFKKKASPAAKADGDESESESDDEKWSEDDATESASVSTEDEGEALAAKFLKKTIVTDKDVDAKKEAGKREKKLRERKVKEAMAEAEGEWQEVKGGAPLSLKEKPKMFAKDAEITTDAVVSKLYEIIAARGKKGTDRSEQISLLLELEEIANANNLGPAVQMTIIFHMIAAVYDYNTNIATCMKAEMWEKCIEHIIRAMDILESIPDMIVSENIGEENQVLNEPPYRVRGCILTIVERMDDEFTKMLQACDAHSNEYVDRLKDEGRVCNLIERVQEYMEKKGTSDEMCRVYQRRIEHLYYKFDFTKAKSIQAAENNEKFDFPESYVDSEKVMNRLCKFIYKHDSTNRIRTRAILCHIYHHALHDNWFEARDLMLMSHLQDTIQHSDVPTQILYNRAMVQLGLCAFRRGLIKDAHHALVDIQSGGRAKELLAQGLLLQRQHERTPEQEKIEKRRQMPYHKHINLELLECVYLVSAMLLEIPYMAAHELDARRRMISKNFHHVLRLSERQTLIGPPETMREHIVAASKAMKTGDWRSCNQYIINEKMNAKVWDLFFQSNKVRQMMTRKIQEESLRTYMFTYSSVYVSISLSTLADLFELERACIHSVISKMIINEELMASLDEPTQSVVMHRTEPTRLQALALQLSEKVSSLVDINERIFEMKQGNYFGFQKQGFQQQQGQGWGSRGGDQSQRGQRGGGGGNQDGGGWKNMYQQNQQRGEGGGGWSGGGQRNYNNRGGGGGGGGGNYRGGGQGGNWSGRRNNQRQGQGRAY